MASWWNRMPQYSGLFDYQDVMRPAYFSFELLARVTGDRLAATSDDEAVHAFFSDDKVYGIYNLLFWNFSSSPVTIKLQEHGLKETLIARRRVLDAKTPFQDENARLRPLPDLKLNPAAGATEIQLEPYGMETWALEPTNWVEQLLGP
jgi:hypothetical protein